MAETAEQHLEAIRQNVHCPKCEYNLRGLRGAEVQCPECGCLCNIARILTARFDRPWHKAPGLNWVVMPVVMAVVGAFFVLISPVVFNNDRVLIGIGLLVPLLGWIGLMWQTWALFQSLEGPALAILAHLILMGYLLAVVGIIAAISAGMMLIIGYSMIGGLFSFLVACILMGLGNSPVEVSGLSPNDAFADTWDAMSPTQSPGNPAAFLLTGQPEADTGESRVPRPGTTHA